MKSVNKADLIFNIFNSVFMLFLVFITVLPFWVCLAGSFSDSYEYTLGGVIFLPRGFNLYNYKVVFMDKTIFDAFLITILRTVIGSISSLLFTSLVAYGMSRKNLKGRNIYMSYMLVTMFFGGGLIPYYVVLKKLGLIDNFLVYIIPLLFSVWNMLVFISYFREIPEVILESARIDGINEYGIFFLFIVPLSKPVFAAIALFTAISHWNSFYDSLVFTSSNKLQTIQLFLYRIISNSSEAAGMARAAAMAVPPGIRKPSSETIKLATMIVTIAPILVTYPFLQKYFIKGVMIGAVKD